MAHFDLRLAICDGRFSLRGPPASSGQPLFWAEFLVTTRYPQRITPAASPARLM
jgi:hypothetical protein